MKKQWLKVLSIVVGMIILVGISIVNAEYSTWNCPQCGRTGNTGNYCGGCAHPAPWISSPSISSVNTTGSIPELSATYPEQKAQLHQFSAANSAESISVYTGPGKSYIKAEKVRPSTGFATTICFIENDWVLTHLIHHDYDKYVFINTNNFDNLSSSCPSVASLSYVNGTIRQNTIPSWGPGSGYDLCRDYTVGQGTSVKVYFQEGNYYYAEYGIAAGTVRMWIPKDSVSL